MDYGTLYWKSRNKNKSNESREPLRTLKEFAIELGINHYSLANMIKNKHVTPLKPEEYDRWGGQKGVIKNIRNTKYYSPSEFKRWWAEYNRVVLGKEE